MPGPPPKPTALKILAGNPGQRRLHPEPQPNRGIPPCPAWLLVEGKREWRRIAPELDRLGLLTVADRAALAQYCQAWARWQQFERALGGEPNDAVGRTLSGQERAFKMLQSALARFGLSPADRSRIHAPEAEPEAQGVGRFLS